MDTVRQTMADLRPPLLDDYGLLAALESHGRQFSLRTGLAVAVQGQRIGARPAPNVELALFRIAQEALANAVKARRSVAGGGCPVLQRAAFCACRSRTTAADSRKRLVPAQRCRAAGGCR
jgi:hypothetical protein